MRANRVEGQPWRRQQLDFANIKAGSYIWQPWFAQISGGLGLILSREHLSGGGDAGGNPVQDTGSTTASGNAELALFPISRFPFNAYFDRSDSRQSGVLTASDTVNTRIGLRQSYRPPEGPSNYAASFNRSTLESAAFGRDTVNALAANMSTRQGAHAFSASGSHTRNDRSNTGERTASSAISARHSFRPEPVLSVENLVGASSSDFHLLSGGVPSETRSRFAQANSFVTWRPEEGSPLYVTGGGRLFSTTVTGNAGASDSLTLSGNLGATYALSPQTSLSGGATVTQVASDAGDSLVTTQSGAVNHVADPFGLLGWTYRWNAGGNFANSTGGPDGGQQNVVGQIGHNLSRELALGSGSRLNASLGQNLSAASATSTGDYQTLSSTGSLSWQLVRGAATTAYMSLTGTDARTIGYGASDFQMFNFQASGQVQFSRDAAASANITVQGVRQLTESTPDLGFNINANGGLSYFHNRAFDVPRLRYAALYNVSDSQVSTRLQGDFNAPRERVSQSFEQRLHYSLGRVEMQLTMRIADIEGRRDAMVFFRMTRAFGAF